MENTLLYSIILILLFHSDMGPETEYHNLIPAVKKLTKEFNSELLSMLFDKKNWTRKIQPRNKGILHRYLYIYEWFS